MLERLVQLGLLTVPRFLAFLHHTSFQGLAFRQ
jgi:hypothetical protein